MSATTEVIISSDASGKLWNSCVWDVNTGATISIFKGGNSKLKTLALIGNDYLIGARVDKPMLSYWSLTKQAKHQVEFVSPGLVTALATSHNGYYCACGINNKIHVWEIGSGNMIAVVDEHYQTVNCLKFTHDDSMLISGGVDGLVKAWQLRQILSNNSSNSRGCTSHYNWSDHTAEVTDIHVGHGGMRARVATVSLDCACKIYELLSGQLLVSLYMDSALTSVTMDAAEYFLFLGSKCGNIFQINLFSNLQNQNKSVDITDDELEFIGHSERVTCLSVSMDGNTLLSGSDDKTVKQWDVHSKQCIRTLKHAAAVTNAFFVKAHYALLTNKIPEPRLVISSFKRKLLSEEIATDVELKLWSRNLSTLHGEVCDESFNKAAARGENEASALSKEALQMELGAVNQINKQLYTYTVDSFIDSIDDVLF